MSSLATFVVLVPLASVLVASAAFLVYAVVRYAPVVGRIFEERPVFLPLRLAPEPGGEDVRFSAEDGVELAGTYYRARTSTRAGVLVFCHEYLSDRWSFRPYVDPMRDHGFDVLTFDFRNHGDSGSRPDYQPLQWVTDHELRDLGAALAYLRSRPDRDPAGYALFGVSRGGSAALCASAADPGVWGVVTDGAFPIRGTMWAYIHRWAEIYIGTHLIWRAIPLWLFNPIIGVLGWASRIRSAWRLNCRFPDVERAVSGLSPRPWLMIHGQKDAYIGPDIARRLFARGGPPKELWIVPGAKHNRCREVEPEAYRERVLDFFRRSAPRRRLPKVEPRAMPSGLDPRAVETMQGAASAAPERLSAHVTG